MAEEEVEDVRENYQRPYVGPSTTRIQIQAAYLEADWVVDPFLLEVDD